MFKFTFLILIIVVWSIQYFFFFLYYNIVDNISYARSALALQLNRIILHFNSYHTTIIIHHRYNMKIVVFRATSLPPCPPPLYLYHTVYRDVDMYARCFIIYCIYINYIYYTQVLLLFLIMRCGYLTDIRK